MLKIILIIEDGNSYVKYVEIEKIFDFIIYVNNSYTSVFWMFKQ